MFDNYLYRIEDNGTFIAGYNECIKTTDENPIFLFTTLRLVRVVGGSAEWRIGERVISIGAGDVVFVNNVEPRQFVHVRGELRCEIFALSPSLLAREAALFELFYGGFEDSVIRSHDRFSHEIGSVLDVLSAAIKSAEGSPLAVTHLFISAASLMLTATAFGKKRKKADTPRGEAAIAVSRAIIYINEHISEEISVGNIARSLGISRGYFSACFKRYTGISPVLYVKRARLDRAIYLMRTERINVLDAALESGFGSSSGFYKAFASVCGMPPKEFIKGRNGNA